MSLFKVITSSVCIFCKALQVLCALCKRFQAPQCIFCKTLQTLQCIFCKTLQALQCILCKTLQALQCIFCKALQTLQCILCKTLQASQCIISKTCIASSVQVMCHMGPHGLVDKLQHYRNRRNRFSAFERGTASKHVSGC